MDYRRAAAKTAIVLGVGVLYSGWWNVSQLLFQGGPCPRSPGPLRGLHLNEFGAVVYDTANGCTGPYAHAWTVFVLLSLAGLLLLGGGIRLLHSPSHSADEPAPA